MEALRFGSSIPGSYWGCCAFDIFQDFSQHPDDAASIEMVCGDEGQPIYCVEDPVSREAEIGYLGKTWREIFEARLVVSTFSESLLPSHGFLAVMTEEQLEDEIGQTWLKILHENGFEFIRAVGNSVYGSECYLEYPDPNAYESNHINYLFGLFRNIGRSESVKDPFKPPQEWAALHGGLTTSSTDSERRSLHFKKYEEHAANLKFYSRRQIEEAGVPVWLAGRRSHKPQEKAEVREEKEKNGKSNGVKLAPFVSPL